jgi:hypothetical protein
MTLGDVAVVPADSPGGDRLSRVRRLAAVSAAPACYVLLACLAYWPAGPLDAHHLVAWSPDPQQQTWALAWPPFALTHGLNPFYTTYLQVPDGGNLAATTAMPLLGLLSSPATWLAGPVAAFNLMLRLGLAASATSMFFVLRRYTSWWPAAFGGGLFFEFSAYLTGQGHKHIFLVFVPLVPLFIPLLDDWLVRLRRAPLWSGLLTGLVTGLQFLISAEICLATVLFATVGLVFLAVRHPAAAWQRLGVLARGLAAAAVVFLLVAGYPIWMLLAGPNHPNGSPHPVSDLLSYHGDLLSLVMPTSNQLLAPPAAAAIGDATVRSLTENGLYLGAPLVILLCYLSARYRRTPIIAVCAVVGITAFVLSLGPTLTVNRHVLLHWMPFSPLAHLPVLQDLEAVRFSLFVQLTAAVIAAVGLDRLRTGQPRPSAPGADGRPAGGARRSALVAAAGVAALLPVVPRLPIHSAPAPVPAFFTGSAVDAVPQGSVALTFPFPLRPHDEAMVWQAASGMRFRLVGGDVYVRQGGAAPWQMKPPGGPVAAALLLAGTKHGGHLPPSGQRTRAAIRRLCARYHVQAIFVEPAVPAGHAVAALISHALGRQPSVAGPLDVWLNVQRDLDHGGRGMRRHPAG